MVFLKLYSLSTIAQPLLFSQGRVVSTFNSLKPLETETKSSEEEGTDSEALLFTLPHYNYDFVGAGDSSPFDSIVEVMRMQ